MASLTGFKKSIPKECLNKTKKNRKILTMINSVLTGEYYLDDGEELDWLTQDLNNAIIFDDKEHAETNFKLYEKAIFEKFGAVCNFGYTNIMKHFEFVEVEIEEV